MGAITAKQLIVNKGHKKILGPIDLEVKKGTITGLIGPSGSGKTTLMRSIVGVQAYQGMLDVLGLKAGARQLRSKIGYVTQSPAIYSDLTVKQNIAYFATIAGASTADVQKVIVDVDLASHENQLAINLSGGQRARVSLAIALLGDPELFVFDEPTVGLDPILRDNLWKMFADLARNGKTLLISSHVMDEAERCDELLLMRDGMLLWNDSKRQLLKHTGEETISDAFVAMIEEAA